MKKEIIQISTISEAHRLLGFDKPLHPLVSVLPHSAFKQNSKLADTSFTMDFYQVSYKNCVPGSFGYGRNKYDFEEGTMIFTSPGQVITAHSFEESEEPKETNGWTMIFHPDLIRKSELGKNINQYSFFSYEVNEALHLSDLEKKTIFELAEKVKIEYSQNIDKHSQKLIISNIELILDYCTRFYDRQFYTRTNMNKDIVSRFENLINDYFDSDKPLKLGLPTVKYCGSELNMSPNYLSDMLKKETGRNAQDHIHFKMIDKAKTLLLASNDTVSHVAYSLGFDYPQHFSKIFKKKPE